MRSDSVATVEASARREANVAVEATADVVTAEHVEEIRLSVPDSAGRQHVVAVVVTDRTRRTQAAANATAATAQTDTVSAATAVHTQTAATEQRKGDWRGYAAVLGIVSAEVLMCFGLMCATKRR